MIFKLFVLWNCKLKKYFQNWFMLSVIFPHILAEKWSWSWSCNWSRSLPVILIFFQWSWSLSQWSLIFDLDQNISDLLQLCTGRAQSSLFMQMRQVPTWAGNPSGLVSCLDAVAARLSLSLNCQEQHAECKWWGYFQAQFVLNFRDKRKWRPKGAKCNLQEMV